MRPSRALSSLPLLWFLPGLALAQSLGIEVTKLASCSRKTKNGDTIKVNYKGTLQSDGTQFDSSYGRSPFQFTLGRGSVIKGWDQGLLDMCIGEGRRLTIPPSLGYGNQRMGPIPPGSTLVFETELMGIEGVEKEVAQQPVETPTSTPSVDVKPTDTPSMDKANDGECHFLGGSWAWIVQGSLALLALSSLVYKRGREVPRRPLNVWYFDVSKQILGSVLLHFFDVITQYQPSPCSSHLLNITIDTIIGIPILVLFLKLLHRGLLLTSLARPAESIRSGNYGNPPQAMWWLKQFVIYVLGLFGMKVCVFIILQLLPWIAWFGDWVLGWTKGSDTLQIVFVIFIFPFIMNAVQYWVIDEFIKDHFADEASQYVVAAGDDSDGESCDEEWLELEGVQPQGHNGRNGHKERTS